MNIFAENIKYNFFKKKMKSSEFVQSSKIITSSPLPYDWSKIASIYCETEGTIRIKGTWGSGHGGPTRAEIRKSDGTVVATFEKNFTPSFDLPNINIEAMQTYDIFWKFDNPNSPDIITNIKIDLCFDLVENVANIY